MIEQGRESFGGLAEGKFGSGKVACPLEDDG